MIPQLPPKTGYIEVEVDGIRQYQKVPTEADEKMQQQEAINASLMLEIAKIRAGV